MNRPGDGIAGDGKADAGSVEVAGQGARQKYTEVLPGAGGSRKEVVTALVEKEKPVRNF